jgi:hypothetical protein
MTSVDDHSSMSNLLVSQLAVIIAATHKTRHARIARRFHLQIPVNSVTQILDNRQDYNEHT